MIYITGDCHRDFRRIKHFCLEKRTTRQDTIVVLGDAGINFYNDIRDVKLLYELTSLPVTLLCIHGNHEMRPSKCKDFDWETYEMTDKPMYRLKKWNGGKVYSNGLYPNVLFAKDGEVYDLNGKKALVCGGAFSPDKALRLARGWEWFPDEQPDTRTKHKVEKVIWEMDGKVDLMLTHTIPCKYLPQLNLSPMDTDRSTEEWLDTIEDSLDYTLWCAGHFHMDQQFDKLRIFLNDIVPLTELSNGTVTPLLQLWGYKVPVVAGLTFFRIIEVGSTS